MRVSWGAWQAVKRKLPPPEPLSQDVPMASAGDYIAPEEYVARDEIFKVRTSAQDNRPVAAPLDMWLPH